MTNPVTRQVGDYLPDPLRQHAPAPDYSLDKVFGTVPDMPLEEHDGCGCPASDELQGKVEQLKADRKAVDLHSADLIAKLTTIRALLAEAPPLSEPPTAEQLILVGIREALE